jgi:hypothetical protein
LPRIAIDSKDFSNNYIENYQKLLEVEKKAFFEKLD